MRTETKLYFAEKINGRLGTIRDFLDRLRLRQRMALLTSSRGMLIFAGFCLLFIVNLLPFGESFSRVGLIFSLIASGAIAILGLRGFFALIDKSIRHIRLQITPTAQERNRKQKFRQLLNKRPKRMFERGLDRLGRRLAEKLGTTPTQMEIVTIFALIGSVIGIGLEGLLLPMLVFGSIMLVSLGTCGLLLSLVGIYWLIYWLDVWISGLIIEMGDFGVKLFDSTIGALADFYVARKLHPPEKRPGFLTRWRMARAAKRTAALQESLRSAIAPDAPIGDWIRPQPPYSAASTPSTNRGKKKGARPTVRMAPMVASSTHARHDFSFNKAASGMAPPPRFGRVPRSLTDYPIHATKTEDLAEEEILIPEETIKTSPTLETTLGWRIVHSRRGWIGSISRN